MKEANKQTLKIIHSIILVQGGVLLLWIISSQNFADYTGFSTVASIAPSAWLAAAALIVVYVWGAASISTVREHMFKLDKLKYTAMLGALISGVFEEIVFRKLLMDYMHQQQMSELWQVLASGAVFGIAHLVWGGKAISAAINATFYTFFLGAGLAIIYILSERNLAVCIIAHTIVTGLIEPGLIKAAVLNKLGYLTERRVSAET